MEYIEVFNAIVRKKKEKPTATLNEIIQEVAKDFGTNYDAGKTLDLLHESNRLYEQLASQKKEGVSRSVFFMQEFERIAEKKRWSEEEQCKILSTIKDEINKED